MARLRSWIRSANSAQTPFPVENLPLGVFSLSGGVPRQGVAIGEMIVDMQALAQTDAFSHAPHLPFELFAQTSWNAFIATGPDSWHALRTALGALLTNPTARDAVEPCLVVATKAALHLPFEIREFTDFYASRCHAENVGTMFRGAENALPANWLHMPVGYNGRASSVVVSGTPVRRPWGQVKPPESTPLWQPSERFDIELELGAIVGVASQQPLSVARADSHIFGFVLLNDWSARDIQAWEYQPLGPFQGKATATTISPWIVMKAALEPFRRPAPARPVQLLPHLQDDGPMLYDIDLDVLLQTPGAAPERIVQTNARELYYSAAQQLAHHSSAGCPMRVGDLLGSGTISGPTRDARGSLLELSWGGKEPLTLASGAQRSFLQDGDVVTLTGHAQAADHRIGFGTCSGEILPALADPFKGE